MPNQLSKKENDFIAERAGIATKFPGLSETTEKYIPIEKKVYQTEKYTQINKNLIDINRIREKRYQSSDSYKITGNTESKSKYPNHFKDPSTLVKQEIITTKPKQELYYNKPYILGSTEYIDRYQKPANPERNEAKVSINPSIDLTHGSYGRPYEKCNGENVDSRYATQYKLSHQWPTPDNLKRFEWLNA